MILMMMINSNQEKQYYSCMIILYDCLVLSPSMILLYDPPVLEWGDFKKVFPIFFADLSFSANDHKIRSSMIENLLK